MGSGQGVGWVRTPKPAQALSGRFPASATSGASCVAGPSEWVYGRSMMKTTAEQVRTGQIITNDYAAPRRLEVAYPVRERFTNPEGRTLDVVRFSGWPVTDTGVRGTWVEAGWGMLQDGRVYVLDDVRGRGAFGELS